MGVPINSGQANGMPRPAEPNPAAHTDGELNHLRRIQALLVDPTRLTRECLANYLREWSPDLDVQVIEGIAGAAPDQLAKPDIVIVNIKSVAADEPVIRRMAADIAAKFGAEVPGLIVSERDETPGEALEAIRLGMRGYFPADLGIGLLIAAIRLVVWGGVFLSPDTITRQVAQVAAGAQGGAHPSAGNGPDH